MAHSLLEPSNTAILFGWKAWNLMRTNGIVTMAIHSIINIFHELDYKCRVGSPGLCSLRLAWLPRQQGQLPVDPCKVHPPPRSLSLCKLFPKSTFIRQKKPSYNAMGQQGCVSSLLHALQWQV